MSEHSSHEDAAALVIRLAVGPTLFVHGYNKVFGSGGLKGTEGWFHSIGFRPAAVHARMAAATEMASGAAITLGAMNPLPNAALIGVMTVAARSDHRDKGFFVFKGGWEYVFVLSAVAAGLAGLGNGRWSLDRLMGNRRRGWKAAFAAAALGVANGAVLLATTYKADREGDEAPSSAAPTSNGNTAAEEATQNAL